MFFLKILGGALIVLAGYFIGRQKSQKLYCRRNFLKNITVFLSSLQTSLRYDCSDIFTIVTESAKRQGLDCLECRSSGKSFAETWYEKISCLPNEYSALKSDKELLNKFGENLGATDVEGQLKHIELYKTQFEKQLSFAEEDIAKKAKLYKTLGLFAGTAVVLMII